MPITLSDRYLAGLAKGVNTPNVVVELELDGGVRRFGFHGGNALPAVNFTAGGDYSAAGDVFAVGSDRLELFGVVAALGSVSSLQNKLDTRSGFSTRGRLSVVITGRENFEGMVRDEYLKGRRVVRKDGFIEPGLTYLDYAYTFTGVISEWTRKGGELTITVADDLLDAGKKIPEENSTNTQYIDYTDMNPVEIIRDIIKSRIGVPASRVDDPGFDSEQSTWLNGWTFSRVLTEPKAANSYLNELQVETNSFVVHDGEKISFKVFAPPVPGAKVEEWTDELNILDGTLSCKSGYKEHFFNRVVVYYDYDESGGDKEENFEAAVIAVDAASQAQWNEAVTRTIKSRWIRTVSFAQPASVTGAVIYHASANNDTGQGTLAFTYDPGGDSTLRWTAPGGSPGEPVKVTKDGKFQVFDADKTKWLRLLVTVDDLPGASQNDAVTISSLPGELYATALAQKVLSRYRDPAGIVTFEVGINDSAFESVFIKPTDLKDLTTGEASGKGNAGWGRERVMLTSVRPDFSSSRVRVEAIQTRMYRKYGFIAPAGQPDWDAAEASDKEYAYIGEAQNNELGAASDPGFYIW